MITDEVVKFIEEEISIHLMIAESFEFNDREYHIAAAKALEELLKKLCEKEFSI